jgi:hypothetical protein
VTTALRDGVIDSDTSVTEVSHEPIGEGVGIVGQLARLQFLRRRRRGRTGTMVLKLPSVPGEPSRRRSFFYEREAALSAAERQAAVRPAATGIASTPRRRRSPVEDLGDRR